jgi:hypothetical protein
MDTTQDIAQVAVPTDVVDPTDLKVEVVSMEFANGTNITVGLHLIDIADFTTTELTCLQNGTGSIHKPDEPFDIMQILADWSHGKNLPSLKSVFVGLAIAVHFIVDFFVRFQELLCVWALANLLNSSTTSYGRSYSRSQPSKHRRSSCQRRGPKIKATMEMKSPKSSRKGRSRRVSAQPSAICTAWAARSPCAVEWPCTPQSTSQQCSSRRRCLCSGR